jgi:RNA polymerase sigma-70 factor (ECF subfamily)
MSDSELNTTQLHGCLVRWQAGDLSAREELVRGVCGRLERITRSMLRGFPNLRRWVETGDVLSNALMRLLASLESVQPPSMRDFYNLAAAMMRRELLDLARHYARANRCEISPRGPAGTGGSARAPEPAAPDSNSHELERWSQFHEEAEKLPVEEREVVGLVFYHGWTQPEVAELFGISVRTVRRLWQSALVKLHGLLHGQ